MEDAVGSRPTTLEVEERSKGSGEGGEENGIRTERREVLELAVVCGVGGSSLIEDLGDLIGQLIRHPSFSAVVVHGGKEDSKVSRQQQRLFKNDSIVQSVVFP